MINFYQNLKKNEIRVIIKNFSSLTSLNFLSLLFPLVLIPYLTRTIGLSYYGQYVISMAIFQYCLILINFGFDYSATKSIAINRDNLVKVSEILINVTAARLILAFISSILIIVTTLIIPNLTDNLLLIYFGIGILWGRAITPIWLFLGIEKMGYVTLINLLTKLISFVLIIIFIKSPNQFYLINLFQSIGYIIGGVASIFLVKKYIGLHFTMPTYVEIKRHVLDSWTVFLSTLSMSFYREANVLILGITTNFEMVGQYGAIEKIVKAMQSFIDPLAKALFPFFGRKFNNSKENLKGFLQFGKYYTLALLLLTISLYFIGPKLILWYLGNQFTGAIFIFKILLPVILFGGLNYYLGIVGLINLGMDKYFFKAVIITGLFSVLICYFLSLIINVKGAAIAMVSSELLLLIMIYRKILKCKNL